MGDAVAVDSSDGTIARTLFFFQLFSLFMSVIGITFGLLVRVAVLQSVTATVCRHFLQDLSIEFLSSKR